MMTKTLNAYKNLFLFGIPLSLFGIMIFLIKSPLFSPQNNSLVLAITLDLLITIPFFYLWSIRKTEIPKTTIVPMIILGLVIGYYTLPNEIQTYLTLFKNWVLPVIELTILTTIIYKVRLALKKYKSIQKSSIDFFTILKESCQEILPKRLIIPFATEIAVFYYGFIHWKEIPLKKQEFSYHKKSGAPALIGALLFIILIESISIHLLLSLWNEGLAWLFTALSIYSGVQLFGFAKSLSKRPIVIEKDTLNVKYGILSETIIPIKNIHKIELSKKTIKDKNKILKLSPLGELDSHNIIIHLRTQNDLTQLYGVKKQFQSLAFFVDKAQEFKEELECKMTIVHQG